LREYVSVLLGPLPSVSKLLLLARFQTKHRFVFIKQKITHFPYIFILIVIPPQLCCGWDKVLGNLLLTDGYRVENGITVTCLDKPRRRSGAHPPPAGALHTLTSRGLGETQRFGP